MHHTIKIVYLKVYFPRKYTSPDVLFHAVICIYRVEAYNLTLAQPSFSVFPLHEDAFDQSCLHKSLVHVHREAKLQSVFSLGSRKFLRYRYVLHGLFFASIVSVHPRCSIMPTIHTNYLFPAYIFLAKYAFSV